MNGYWVGVERGMLTVDGRCSHKVGATLGAPLDTHKHLFHQNQLFSVALERTGAPSEEGRRV